MSKINIRKRGNFYEYRIEIAKVDNKRQWLSKSGFRTKAEALESGSLAYTEYLNAGIPFKQCDLSYSDYLDYWLENYCMNNLKYNTIQTYKIIINKYLKKNIGKYKLSTITSVALNSYITDLVNKYNHSKTYYKNILKVIKGSFRDACNLYGFIKYNPALTLRLPKIEEELNNKRHYYTNEEIDKIIDRFKNPYLKDDVARVGREPLRKLNENDRLIKPLITARGFNINTDNLLLGVGAALHYDNKEDAQSVQLQSLINEKGIKESLAEISKISGDTDVLDKVEKYYDEVKKLIGA